MEAPIGGSDLGSGQVDAGGALISAYSITYTITYSIILISSSWGPRAIGGPDWRPRFEAPIEGPEQLDAGGALKEL